jgi:hypothetical protein
MPGSPKLFVLQPYEAKEAAASYLQASTPALIKRFLK